MATSVYPIVYSNTLDISGSVQEYQLPNKIKCDSTSEDTFLVSDCTTTWNCTGNDYCGSDAQYIMEIPDGAEFDLQLGIYDRYSNDYKNPNLGWGDWINIELCDFDGNIIESDINNISSEYSNIWTGTKNVQTIRVDTSLFAGDCFTFRVTTTDGKEYCSQHFQRAHNCTSLIEIEGIYDDSDCLGNYYGNGYSNKTWIPATFIEKSANFEKVEFGNSGSIEESTTNCIYYFSLKKPIPPYLHHVIAKQVFNADRVIIGGKEYEILTADFANIIEYGRMFLYQNIQFVESCERECI